MSRSPIGIFAQRVVAQVEQRRANRHDSSRRDFLARIAASLALAGCAVPGASIPIALPPANRTSGRSGIVVVGAGVAGMTCAYRLRQAVLHCDVYEANTRAGGRTWTLRGFFADNQITEHGGQLIASTHHHVRRLASELGLPLIDLNALYPKDARDTYMISGQRYSVREAVNDYDRWVHGPLVRAARAAGYPTTFFRHTPQGAELDRTSVDAWLDKNVHGGSRSKIGTLLRLACLSEYGGETSEQSSLNLIFLLSGMRRGGLNLSGTGEDDRYTIDGGNDQLVERIIAQLPNKTMRFGTSLEALRHRGDGSYECTFKASGATKVVRADVVVLSIPFTVLRLVDCRHAGFSQRKLRAIADLDLGSNAKVHLQFDKSYWFEERYSGTAYADEAFQDAWDISIGQPGKAGMLVCFPGGSQGARYRGKVHGAAPPATVREYLASLEPALPGAQRAFSGRAYQDFWIGSPFTRGAYSYYKLGQYTTLAGVESLPEGNVHFCGEQTSYNWQGYINGAVQSGERVAREILARRSM
ncbi:MAG TPA: NAD(P)/FAD-dependent oxidoreductase [Candidatus Baltobacteraceae bacterium]|nr:NAD(P)/FAD-dependent oxidoreductase [Candidatus Baltobacteraceae bacterium]